MKPKYLALAVLLFAILGVGLWWFRQAANVSLEKTTTVPALAKPPAPKPVMQTAQVEPPKIPAVPASSSNALANPAPDPNDPQADLKTAIPDIVHWLQADDIFTFRKNYA